MSIKFCEHGRQEATCPFCNDKEGTYCDCENPVFKTMPTLYDLGICVRCGRPIPDGNSTSKYTGIDKTDPTEKHKLKMLFVDDNSDRLHFAMKKYSLEYDVTIAPNFSQAMRQLSQNDFDVVSLDHDMNGCGFEDIDSPTCGMAIVRYIEKTGWPEHFKKPTFWIHSVNGFASHLMMKRLRNMGFECIYDKFSKRGIVAGAFDIIHPGYICMFKDAKSVCSYLIVALNVDPSIAHPEKKKPIFTVEERTETLLSLHYVDEVVPYRSELELTDILVQKRPDIRIMGNDHQNYTSRPDMDIEVYYRDRKETEWSMTKLREAVKNE